MRSQKLEFSSEEKKWKESLTETNTFLVDVCQQVCHGGCIKAILIDSLGNCLR